jgi:lycopene cyclase domain-containing protein
VGRVLPAAELPTWVLIGDIDERARRRSTMGGTGQYLMLLVLCLVITLPLELIFGARVYRRPGRLLLTLLPVVLLFAAWDLLGILRDHWRYNPDFVTGLRVGLIPIEELAFFVVIPICGLLTYGAVGELLTKITKRTAGRRPVGGDDA